MEFEVVIPVLNQFRTLEECFETWISYSKSKFKVVFIDNGSEKLLCDQKFIKEWGKFCHIDIVRNPKNIGVYPTFQQGFENALSTFIFYSHSDVKMNELGWDQKLRKILLELIRSKKPGVCGMFGAKGLGSADIYKAPYDYRQLGRWNCVTVPSMIDAGARVIDGDYERIITLDGFSLIVKRSMVARATNFFDIKSFPVHHNYDHDICLTSHYMGYENYVIDVDCRHLGGVTSTRESWAEEMGSSDLAIHRDAHRVLYEKYRGRLPAFVR